MASKEYQKQWHQDHREERMPILRRQKRERLDNMRLWIQELKESEPCVDCGLRYPYWVMDFDHLDGKVLNVSQAVQHGWGRERLQSEIDKCELVCSNCHRTRTHNRRTHGSLAETD